MARARAGREAAQSENRSKNTEISDLAKDNNDLHAEVSSRFKVAEQQQGNGERSAFTFSNIFRDLKVRLASLNSGAANLRKVTQIYSSHVAADGRDLQLESGSARTVCRWEKRCEILFLITEGRALRNALRTASHTRLCCYMDLSPDARAIEQFGEGLEYSGIRYAGCNCSPSSLTGRLLSGSPLTLLPEIELPLGLDGCPTTIEWNTRVFVPMLAALGPKYAATADCFMRALQVYGLTPEEMLDPDFRFASMERPDVEVPLLDLVEHITSDAGGEVHKRGGVIETVAPNAQWNHCCSHGGNLGCRKSSAFENAGLSVRQTSSFLRGGDKHTLLVHHMLCIQDPSRIPDHCDPRLRAMYVAAHALLEKEGYFTSALGGTEVDPSAVEENITSAQTWAAKQFEKQIMRKSKKGNDIRRKYELEVVDDRLVDVVHLLAPAILIAYGGGAEYSQLTIDEDKNKTAFAIHQKLIDPGFLFWATHMRLLHTMVYRSLFATVQSNQHHAAPLLAGPEGAPIKWAAKFRSAITIPDPLRVSSSSEPLLNDAEDAPSAPLLAHLKRHPSLGGIGGTIAKESAADFFVP